MCGSAVCVPVSVHVCVRVLFVCYGGGGVTACFWRGLVPFSSLAGWHAPGADGTDWEHEHCHALGWDRNSLFPLSSPDSIFDPPPPSYLLFSSLLFFPPPFLFTPVCNCFQKKKKEKTLTLYCSKYANRKSHVSYALFGVCLFQCPAAKPLTSARWPLREAVSVA